ncbi:MAG: AAA family ATPase [Chloroflexi bacterium]|nr:AAA family ATPase [Chloroflexota bacterium]
MNADERIFAALSPELRQKALAHVAISRNGTHAAATLSPDNKGIAPLRSLTLAELLQKEFAPLDFLVDGIIAKGHFVMLGGRAKSGKSWLVLQLAKAIDLGEPFLGRSTQRGRVLLIVLEDGKRRINQRGKILKWQPQQAEVVFQLPRFDGENGQPGPGLAQIEAYAEQFDLVIIDTLIATLSGRMNENDNAAMGAIVNEIARIAHETDTAIVLVHHTGKGNSENIFDLLRGASAIRGAYDVGMLLERKQTEKEAILHLESRDVDVSDMTIRQVANGVGWESLGDSQEIQNIRAGREIVLAIETHGEGLTVEELAEATGKTKQTINQQLNLAQTRGLVHGRKQNKEHSKKPVSIWYLGTQASQS